MKISHLYSLSTLKQTFDIKTLDDVIPVTISLDSSKYMPSGAPGIVKKNDLLNAERLEGRHISVLFPFPPKTGITPGTCIKIHSKNIYELPQKNLIVGHKVKTIDMFNINNLRKIRDFVKDNAAITFALFDTSNAVDFFTSIPDICSKYRHSPFFYHYGEGLGGHIRNTDDVFVSFVSFIDINYCIPIFDHRKVDGMGVYCGFMYNNKHNKSSVLIDVLCFVLSKYGENLFYTDGARVSVESKISTDVLKYMIQRIKLKSKCKAKETVTDKVKKAKGKENIFVNAEEELGAYANIGDEKGKVAMDPEQGVKYATPTFNRNFDNTSATAYTISGSWS